MKSDHIRVGDYLTIQYKSKSGYEAKEVPHEATDRLCSCVAAQKDEITVRFPYPVKMGDGAMTNDLTIPREHKLYRLQREQLADGRPFPRGRTAGAYMVPVEMLWENYWLKIWGENVSNTLLSSQTFKGLEESIKREGLRAPVLVTKDGLLRAGSHRVLIYRRLGHKEIEGFIVA